MPPRLPRPAAGEAAPAAGTQAAESEASTLGGRVRRYARVGRAVGGLAVELAGKRYLGLELDRGRHASELAAALGGLKGPLMKVAQLLSTIPDALPSEYAKELSTLQANAPAMGWPFVKRRMAAELGPDWQGRYKSFEHAAARAASLGQVHRAVSLDGKALACKLQYPEMASTVAADLRQLKLVFAIYERADKAISTKNIHAELTERLMEELDYAREARHMRLYAEMLASEKGVRVPELLPELSTRRLLTMSWLEGAPLLSCKEWPLERRNKVAHNMFRAWYVPFYFYGVIHGDPHLGNYTVRPDGSINLLDFGCIRVFHSRFVRGVIDLYWALDREDEALAVHAYETWGFTNLSREVIETLNLWARFVYAPLMEDRERAIEETNSGVYGAKVAEKVHKELRRLGGVTPPREFVLMDRAAIGLGSVFLHLAAEINWHRLFHELIRGFDETALAERQAAALERQGLPAVM
jgi:predicted unusual protein kinase regulating ubiquinone biosynthesis (AarF/ABC1/UbiB family)